MRSQNSNSFHIKGYWSLLRDRCKSECGEPRRPPTLTLSAVSLLRPCGLRESRGEIMEEARRVRGEVGVVVAVAETWGERCWTVGMWDVLSDISVWITAREPSNPFGPALPHHPPRTAGLAWLGLDWFSLVLHHHWRRGERGCWGLEGSFWKERTWDYMCKLRQERWGDREGTGAASEGATKDWCQGSKAKQDNLLDLWTLHWSPVGQKQKS